MKLVIEQAGSLFTGWITSCLSCLHPEGDGQNLSRRHAMRSLGVEREMRVSHTQPHLVTPMKLTVYDDLPSPGPPPRTSSLPSWIAEGRNIASRASNRASLSLKRQSTTPLRISAPTEFRRVDSFQPFAPSPTEFQPLVLKIHTTGHRLSTLPAFGEFSIVDEQPLARPSRALFSPTDNPRLSRTRSHHPTSSVQLARKPVGSGSRRSSLATLEQLLDKQSPSVASPLLPHFSNRSSVTTGVNISVSVSDTFIPSQHKRHESIPSYSRPPPPPPVAEDESQQNIPKPPPKSSLQDRPLSFPSLPTPNTPSTQSSSSSLDQQSHASPATSPETTPSRNSRVTQWLFQTTTTTPPPKPPRSSDKAAFRTRKSSNTTITTLSGTTAISSPRTPPSSEKHLEHLPPSATGDAPSYSTIHEDASQYHFDELPYNHHHQHQHQHHRQSTIGIAF